MAKPKIVVTGATGKTGGALAAQLLHARYPVRAWVHRFDARSARLLALGAEVVVVDLADAEHLAGALHGAQRAYTARPTAPTCCSQPWPSRPPPRRPGWSTSPC